LFNVRPRTWAKLLCHFSLFLSKFSCSDPEQFKFGAHKRAHKNGYTQKFKNASEGWQLVSCPKVATTIDSLSKKVHQTTLSLLSMTLKTSHIFILFFVFFFVCYGDRKQCPKSIDTVHLQTIALGDIITHMNTQIIMVSSRVSH